MSTVVDQTPIGDELRKVVRISRKPVWAMGVMLVIVLLLLTLRPAEGNTRFRFSSPQDWVQIPNVNTPGMTLAWISLAIAAALLGFAIFLLTQRRATPMWLVSIFAILVVTAFLAWAGAGSTADFNITRLVGNTVLLAVPLIFGALGGVIGERAGVVNIAIEAQLLGGAFSAALISSITDSPWLGLVAAIIAGVLVAGLLVIFAINNRVEQVIVGVVVNVLVIGLTSFMFGQVLTSDPARFNSSTRFPNIALPLISEIPIIGPALFRQSILIYLMYLMVPAVWFLLFRTKWGLRVRAVGEHPKAADTMGINVNGTRRQAVFLGGAIAGMGGAFYTVVSVSQFTKEMTAGAGYIALAAVIFGKWHPLRAAAAALLFGFASALEQALSLAGAPVPSQFMLMLPYV
ncbi:MAG TPA: ABC transporter permease, partial [Actinomycetales bacterium]|nr:ABC transporter permease [Actinomycetales bacterium]